jgi:hypothetical protein
MTFSRSQVLLHNLRNQHACYYRAMPDAGYLRQLEQRAETAIRAAFQSGDPPTSAELQADHCRECSETNAIFKCKRWEEVAAADLVGNPPVSLLTPAAFQYYLPALMLRTVEAPQQLDCLPAGVIGMLSAPNGKPSARLADLLRKLDEAQIAAVRAFLSVCEAREKLDRCPPEAFASAPVSKPLARAIAFWGLRGPRANRFDGCR